jgi:hypothetical protein
MSIRQPIPNLNWLVCPIFFRRQHIELNPLGHHRSFPILCKSGGSGPHQCREGATNQWILWKEELWIWRSEIGDLYKWFNQRIMDGVDQRIVLARDKWNKFLGQLTRWVYHKKCFDMVGWWLWWLVEIYLPLLIYLPLFNHSYVCYRWILKYLINMYTKIISNAVEFKDWSRSTDL